MAKYLLRLTSILIILFITVPLIASIGSEHTYSLPITGFGNKVSLMMPDGKLHHVSREEFFSGAVAAYLPDETDVETLKAACVLLNTLRLTENGVFYFTENERMELSGDYKERQALYCGIWENTKNQSLVLSDGDILSLDEYMRKLPSIDGSYDEKLAFLFPGGGIMTKTGEA